MGEAHGWDNDKAQGSTSREHQCGGIKKGPSPTTARGDLQRSLRSRSPLPRSCAVSPAAPSLPVPPLHPPHSEILDMFVVPRISPAFAPSLGPLHASVASDALLVPPPSLRLSSGSFSNLARLDEALSILAQPLPMFLLMGCQPFSPRQRVAGERPSSLCICPEQGPGCPLGPRGISRKKAGRRWLRGSGSAI